MNIKFTNALIAKGENLTLVEGDLWVRNNKIEFIGSSDEAEFSDIKFDRVIDCKGNLLMPSIKNAHTHSAMTFARSLCDNQSLNDWLTKQIFPREAKLTDEHIYWFTLLADMEYISGGVTSAFDMYFCLDSSIKATVEAGLRNTLCCSVNDFGGIDVIEEEYLKYNSVNELINYIPGFHAEYTTSLENLKKVSELSHKYRTPIFAHISETRDEVQGCKQRHNMTPPMLMDSLGMFDYGGGGFHCVWFDDNDFELFKKKNLYAVINTCSNLKLASGIANVSRFYEEGINVALGTDGAGSNNALNMFREMYVTTVLQNVTTNNPSAIDPLKIIKSATNTSSMAMGVKESNCLEVGKLADLIMIDMTKPSMQPINNPVNNIVYSGGPEIVKLTMCNGQILYEDGKYLTIDSEEVIKNVNRLSNDLRNI